MNKYEGNEKLREGLILIDEKARSLGYKKGSVCKIIGMFNLSKVAGTIHGHTVKFVHSYDDDNSFTWIGVHDNEDESSIKKITDVISKVFEGFYIDEFNKLMSLDKALENYHEGIKVSSFTYKGDHCVISSGKVIKSGRKPNTLTLTKELSVDIGKNILTGSSSISSVKLTKKTNPDFQVRTLKYKNEYYYFPFQFAYDEYLHKIFNIIISRDVDAAIFGEDIVYIPAEKILDDIDGYDIPTHNQAKRDMYYSLNYDYDLSKSNLSRVNQLIGEMKVKRCSVSNIPVFIVDNPLVKYQISEHNYSIYKGAIVLDKYKASIILKDKGYFENSLFDHNGSAIKVFTKKKKHEDDYIYEHTLKLNNYSYVPNTFKFIGDNLEPSNDTINQKYLGVEVELDGGGNSPTTIATIQNMLTDWKPLVWATSDGSLRNGFEMKTNPITLTGFSKLNWDEALDTAKLMGFSDLGTAGLHVHINKSYIERKAVSWNVYGAIIAIMDFNWNDIIALSRRGRESINRWAKNTKLGDAIIDILNSDGDLQRYHLANNENHTSALNLSKTNTIEFRIFKGIIDKEDLFGSVQFASNFVDYAIKICNENKGAKLAEVIKATTLKDIVDYAYYPELTSLFNKTLGGNK